VHVIGATPIERHGDVWLKRDDTFEFGGVRGGKVRTCAALAHGAFGLVTAGSRASPQVNIVAHVARAYNVPCAVFVPAGDETPEIRAARAAGASVYPIRPGHNSVIKARAAEFWRARAALGWFLIPFGMETPVAVEQTAAQVPSLFGPPWPTYRRIVVPVGSGMSLAGVLRGLDVLARTRPDLADVPVLGVVVGADPTPRLDRYAPLWRFRCTLVPAGVDYHDAVDAKIDGVRLDPHYEAKCARFLKPDDLLWIVGIRQSSEGT
jgi:1-aminocyclopropane-1-carboxylate deaminase/D-cysteine desulfhydrase-like pyridoxal-dependent ACC family enzyme